MEKLLENLAKPNRGQVLLPNLAATKWTHLGRDNRGAHTPNQPAPAWHFFLLSLMNGWIELKSSAQFSILTTYTPRYSFKKCCFQIPLKFIKGLFIFIKMFYYINVTVFFYFDLCSHYTAHLQTTMPWTVSCFYMLWTWVGLIRVSIIKEKEKTNWAKRSKEGKKRPTSSQLTRKILVIFS